MFNNPFREQAIAASAKRQNLDLLLRVTAPHERFVLAAVGLVLLGLAIWIPFGGIPRNITLDGVLQMPGQRHDVVATESGYLLEFLVEPGDRVERGAAIARQSTPLLARETAVIRDRVARLEREVEQDGGETGHTPATLAAARVALVQMEARRTARELLVSQAEGVVANLRLSPGDHLSAGAVVARLRDAEDRHLRATLHVAPRVAQRLRPGMRASVEVQLSDGATRRLEGTVVGVPVGSSPAALSAAAVTESALRIDIDLEPASDPTLRDGTPCRVRIELGRTSLASLLGFGSA